jgi:hypothetical protein
MKNITVLAILLLLPLFSACGTVEGSAGIGNGDGNGAAPNDADKDNLAVYDYLYDSYPSEMFGGGEPLLSISREVPRVYVKYREINSYKPYLLYAVESDDALYNKDDFLYIGDIRDTGKPISSLTADYSSNMVPEGTRVYRINARSLYVEFTYGGVSYRAVGEEMTADSPPPCVFVEGALYETLYNEDERDRQDTSGLEYLGSVAAATDDKPPTRGRKLVPDEEFTAFALPVGTDIYRINESSVYIENLDEGIFCIGRKNRAYS